MAGDIIRDVEHFDRWSRTYERSIGQVFLFNRVHKAVIGLVASLGNGEEPERVLDVGCGTGRLMRRAARRWPNARFFGVDPAAGMVEAARRLAPWVEFHVGKGEAIPLADSYVDVAFSTVSFHHWEDQAKGLQEVLRVLRPGGCFCLADGAIPGPAGRLIPHTRMHTPAEFRKMFAAAGYEIAAQRRVVYGAVLATIGRKP
jgi:ubiquinone/menaquinone biosynthesis C-methylase UbiE